MNPQVQLPAYDRREGIGVSDPHALPDVCASNEKLVAALRFLSDQVNAQDEEERIAWGLAVHQMALSEIARKATSAKHQGFGAPWATENDCMEHLLRLTLGDNYDREMSGVATYDYDDRVINVRPISVGTMAEVSLYPREVIEAANADRSRSILIYHTHPGKSAQPSLNDLRYLQVLMRLLGVLQISVRDDVIMARSGEFFSCAEHGLLDPSNLDEMIDALTSAKSDIALSWYEGLAAPVWRACAAVRLFYRICRAQDSI